MTATNASIDLAPTLVPAPAGRRWAGFRNLLRRELAAWWSTKVWWIQTLTWVVLIDGIAFLVSLDREMSVAERFTETMRTPFLVSVVVVGIGAVITVQGAIVGEKESGTAAWVLSKPASRASFIMAKVVAHSFGFLVTAILVPAAVFAVMAAATFPGMVDYGAYAAGVAVVALSMVFYVTLTVCLGTLFRGRGPVAGIGVGLILTGQLLGGMFPLWLVERMPWTLGDVAASLAVGAPPAGSTVIPIASTAVGVVILCAVAIWRFRREEL